MQGDGKDAEGLTRRTLIAAGAAAGFGLALGRPSPARAARGRVLIVGAGLAGLTCAYEAERRGWETTVLEARERLGGRVWTMRFGDGLHAEAGGEFVDTRHGELRDLCRRFDLRLEDVRYGWGGLEDVVFRRGVRRLRWRFRTAADSRQVGRFWERLYDLVPRVHVGDPAADGGARLDRRSAADFLDDLGISGRARFLLETELRDDYGVEPARLSLLFVCLSERAAWNQPDGGVEAFRIRGGNARLAAALADRVAGPLLTGTEVASVEWGPGGVRAIAADGASFEADHGVLACPLPALRRVSFAPALPGDLRSAAGALRYASVVKTVLRYRRNFWRRADRSGDSLTDLDLGSTWEATDRQPGPHGILLSYSAGSRGAALARRGGQRTSQVVAGQVGRVFPGSGPLLLETRRAAWPADRFAGGAWVTYAPRQVLEHWPAVHEPFAPRLHLAGEHTAELSGYMESAIRSGLDAARRLGA